MRNGLLRTLYANMKQGLLMRHPLYQQYQRMMAGKNFQQRMDTLKNAAESRHIDLNNIRLSNEDLRILGIDNSPAPTQGDFPERVD